MVTKIYTPAEVADILQVPEEVVVGLIDERRLLAFQVNGRPRITEEQVQEFIENNPYGRSRATRKRKRNAELEKACRERIITQVRGIAPDVSVDSRGTHFTANGRQGIVAVATTPGRDGLYWYGFKDDFLRSDRASVLVLGLADRRLAIVVPCERFKHVLEGLSMDAAGQRKLKVGERSGSYYLIGKGIEQPLPVDSYVNAFDLIRSPD